MNDAQKNLILTFMNEILSTDQLLRSHISKHLPKGMELSHFLALNYLSQQNVEKSPADLAKVLNLTRGAMTNTLRKLEWQGWVHIRPDWDDARRKMVSISPSGHAQRNAAISEVSPVIQEFSTAVPLDKMKLSLPILRDLRIALSEKP